MRNVNKFYAVANLEERIMLELTADLWLTSDHHFGHQNIIKYSNRDVGFEELHRRWQQTVGQRDPLLHLGDYVWYAARSKWYPLARRHHGTKYIIPGNHDRTPQYGDQSGWQALGMAKLKPFTAEFEGQRILFSHRPQPFVPGGDWDFNVHGHIHNNPYPSYCDSQYDVWWNVSVEVMGYRPQRLADVVAKRAGWGICDQGVWEAAADPERQV